MPSIYPDCRVYDNDDDDGEYGELLTHGELLTSLRQCLLRLVCVCVCDCNLRVSVMPVVVRPKSHTNHAHSARVRLSRYSIKNVRHGYEGAVVNMCVSALCSVDKLISNTCRYIYYWRVFVLAYVFCVPIQSH